MWDCINVVISKAIIIKVMDIMIIQTTRTRALTSVEISNHTKILVHTITMTVRIMLALLMVTIVRCQYY